MVLVLQEKYNNASKNKASNKKNQSTSDKSKQNKASAKSRTPKGQSEKTKYVGNDKNYTLSFSQTIHLIRSILSLKKMSEQ